MPRKKMWNKDPPVDWVLYPTRTAKILHSDEEDSSKEEVETTAVVVLSLHPPNLDNRGEVVTAT